jgi:hypothetical protein
LVVSNIILLNGVNSAGAFIATENVDIAILKNYRWHGASLLIEVGNSLPPIHVNRVPFAALEHSIYRPSSNRINKVALMRQSMRISALIQLRFLRTHLILSIVHKHTPRHISKTGVKPTSNENIPICKTDAYRVTLKAEVVRDLKKHD